MQLKKMFGMGGSLMLGLLCSAFWWYNPQGLSDGDYTLTITGSGEPLVKQMVVAVDGGDVALKADGMSISGFLSGIEFTGYSTSLGGMLIHGQVSGDGLKGDGVIRYKSKSPSYIEFTLVPRAGGSSEEPQHHANHHSNNNAHHRQADPLDPLHSNGISNNAQNAKEGTFKDSRDLTEYKTVEIGGKTWMAENINYNTNDGGSYINFKNPEGGYGRYYSWASAKKACPPGWHLPSDEEWKELVTALGDNAVAKIKTSSGWNNAANGTNESGFAAKAGGYFSLSTRAFDFAGDKAFFWTSTEYFGPDAYAYSFAGSDKTINRVSLAKTYGNSCRCVKD